MRYFILMDIVILCRKIAFFCFLMSTVLIANFSFSLKIIEQKTNGKIEIA